MSDHLIYERQTGQKYTIENGYERPDGQGGRIIKQGFIAYFKPRGDSDYRAEFDATAAAEQYADREIRAGRADYKDRDKIVREREKRLQDFIESHEHYTRTGGLGLIWKKKSEAEIIAEREASIAAQIEALEERKKKLAEKDGEVVEEEKRGPGRPSKKDELVVPVGVTAGVATTNTARAKG